MTKNKAIREAFRKKFCFHLRPARGRQARGNRKVFCAFYQKILVPLCKNRLAVQRLEITNLFLCAICIHKVLTKQEYPEVTSPVGCCSRTSKSFRKTRRHCFISKSKIISSKERVIQGLKWILPKSLLRANTIGIVREAV